MPRLSPNDRHAIASAEAVLTRDIERTWRQWKAFIVEQADLLAQQAAAALDADLTDVSPPTPRTARLDAATRQQFGAVLEARRQQAQAHAERGAREAGQPLPDAEQVYATVVQHIADELDGKVHPAGLALVWYRDTLMTFDAQAVLTGTTEADYLTAQRSGPTTRQAALLLVLMGVLLVALVVLVRWAFPAAPVSTAQTGSVVQVGQQDIPLWTVQAVAVGAQVTTAQMRGGYPAVLCLGDGPPVGPGTTIVVTGTQAIRRYQVQAAGADREADLLLTDCATPTGLRATARLVETQTRRMLDAALLRTVTVRSPDRDPQAIPPDQMEVLLDLALPDAELGTLVLADGRRWTATRSTGVAGSTRLTYMVPLAQTTQPAGFEVAQGADLPALLAFTLPAPTSRATLLRRWLHVQADPPTVTLHDGTPALALTLRVTLAAEADALDLQASDLTAEAGGMPVDVGWTPPALVPGQATTIALQLPMRADGPIVLALAAWRVRLNPA